MNNKTFTILIMLTLTLFFSVYYQLETVKDREVKDREEQIFGLEMVLSACRQQLGEDIFISYKPTQKEIEYYNNLFELGADIMVPKEEIKLYENNR